MRTRNSSLLAALVLTAVAGVAHAGSLTPMPMSLMFPSTGTGATSASQTVMLTNSGNATITLDSITFGGADPSDFALVDSPQLPVALAPGVSLPFGVAFTPTMDGARMATLQAQVHGEPSTTNVALTGQGVGPKITVTPSPIAIGDVRFGQPVPPQTVSISNAGGATETVTALSITGPDAALFSLSNGPTLPVTLSAGQSVSVTIAYAPQMAGQANAVLEVDSSDPKTPVLDTPIVGRSGDPTIAVDVGTIIFGNQRVNQPAPPQDVNISNNGYSDLHISTIQITGANSTDYTITAMPPLPATVGVGQSVKITVVWKPLAAGARSGAIQIVSDDPLTPQKKIAMSGVGTTPLASVTPMMIDFGKVKVSGSASQTITIENKGTGPVAVTSLSITGNDKALFTASLSAPFNVAPMSSTVVQVTYKPTQVASASATVTLTTDDPNLTMFQVPLTGQSTAPMLGVSPMSLDFGGLPVSMPSAPQTFTISNTGNQVMTVMSFDLSGPSLDRYTVSPTPAVPFTIASGKSMTFSVTYTPKDASSDDAEVDFAVDDPSNMSGVVMLHGFGQEAALSVTPMDMDTLDFGTVNVGAMKMLPVRIQNTGDAPLVISQLTLAGMSTGFSLDQQAPLSIDALKTQTVNVIYAPKAAGMQMATLEIDPADTNLMPVTINLSGTATAPAFTVSPATLDFGPVVVGATNATLDLMITNSDMTAAHTIDHVSSSDAHFTVDTSTLTTQVAAGANTLVHVTFVPDMAMPYSAQIGVYVAGNATPIAMATAMGTGIQPTTPPGRGGCAVTRGLRGERAGGRLTLVLGGAMLALARRRRRRPAAPTA